MKTIHSLLLLLAVLVAFPAGATDFKLERVASGLGVPWGMVFLDADTLLFTERNGRVGRLVLSGGEVRYLDGVPAVFANGQGGLLDLAPAPDFEGSNRLYFTYSKAVDGQGATTLARARLEGERLVDWQDLLLTRSRSDTTRHFGSRIAFDGEGHLFFSVGDRGVRPNGQDLTTHAGSILRLNLDGSVPQNNPFVGRDGALPEIWSYGHRNPQGLVYDAERKRLWSIEHGPRGGDEINLILRGRNYGWAVVSQGKEYWGPFDVGEAKSREGMEDPRKVYIPSIAPGSLLLYTGKAFPEWQGNLFAGALKLQHLNRIVLSDEGQEVKEERLLENINERIRALAQSPEGWIYLSTDSGNIYRLRPE